MPSPAVLRTIRRRSRLAGAGVALAAVALLVPAAAGAAPRVDGEFALSETPKQLTTGPDGNVWVVLGGAKDVARVTPDGTVTEFDAPTFSAPFGIVTGPDGNLWATYVGGVARIPPGDPAAAVAFPIAALTSPGRIVVGPDGNLWTASGENVLRISPASPATATAFPVAGMGARGIAAATDGQLWIVDFGSQRVVRMATDGSFTTVPVGGGPQDIAAGPDGQVLFTNPGALEQHVGRLTGGATAPLLTPMPGDDPFGVAFGPDGAYWTANFARDTLGRIAVDGSRTTLTGLSAASGPRYLTAGPGNTLWVGLERTSKVARVVGVDPPAGGGGGGGGGGGETPPRDVTAPRISNLSLVRRSFRAGRAVTPEGVRARGGAIGTIVRLRLSEPAAITVAVERPRDGRRSGGRCVAPSRRLRKAKRCTRIQQVGVLRATGREGRNEVAFSGRIKGRSLAPGSYRLRVGARDAAGNVATERPARVTIVRAR
ncbi:hydrolase [Patulibacter medicamentivorans]|uniref:Hydrolase n=1 Tax=Patulibacter medicamentivorans TaxID=1097667 RepID=H0EAC6_9ACTN|nr:hypothetical protein [Patulibacter medicamentivorans]EHN09380.1 hydrolase [Patulibacter medicamentivorans]